MSTFSRLVGMAKKALGEPGGSDGANGRPPARSTDWGSLARSAMDAVRGGDVDDRRRTEHRDPGYAPPRAADRYAPPRASHAGHPTASNSAPLSSADRAAVARYDYLLQTADPHQVEQINREAFERLTPAQRSHVEARMRAELPPGEQPRSAGAADLARSATRSEMMRPGSVRGLLARAGGAGRGRGAGGVVLGAAGGILAAVAGGAVLSTVAAPLLDQAADVDFDALGAGIDIDGVAGEVEGIAGDVLGTAGEVAAGAGDQVSSFGEQISGFGLGGLFDR